MIHFRLLLATVGLIGSMAQAAVVPASSGFINPISNPKAKPFHVSRNVPGIPFALNDSYAGYLPVSKGDTSREIFFWMFPADTPTNNTVLWLQGGPGCSGLEGLFEESGPISLLPNSTKVIKNPYSWTRAANIIFVDQPIGTGLSRGTVKARNEDDVSRDLIGFLENFFDVFQEFKGNPFYITAESYGGMYGTYLADAIYSRPDAVNAKAGINLKGLATIDALMNEYWGGQEIPALPYAIAHQHDLKLSDDFLKRLTANASAAGILGYLDKWLTYPPKARLPVPQVFFDNPDFSIWNSIYDEAKASIGPSFNMYNTKPEWSWYAYQDPLGENQDLGFSATNFVNNVKGLKEAIHADPSIQWRLCGTRQHVFVNDSDSSPAPDNGVVLNRVIDRSTRTLIQHGLQDFRLLADGTRLAIQNTTFGGLQGFQQQPHRQFIVDGKVEGTYHYERKVMYIEYTNAGHEIPFFVPDGAFKALRYLVGDISVDELGK
ncbi:hypothetical protein CF319_g7755 [Tilletia indica]|nr:hypothetical protein CF319_g7755 [Tilletia indica]